MNKTFTTEETLEECLKYYNGELLPASVVQKKYLLRDKEGKFLESTPNDMHNRLAKEFVRIEQKMNPDLNDAEYFMQVRNLLHRFQKTVPQGSPMAAIGNPFQIQSLSNCFVVSSPLDNIEGIFKTGLEIAQIQKRRGGVGVDLSTLRPLGSIVNNAAGKSAGVPCFSDFYSHITRMIGQLGRQGALMITLDVRHPDIFNFIKMKSDLKKVTGANVSIKLSDAFMKAVDEDKNFRLQWPVDAEVPEIIHDVKARDVWDEIVDAAWKSAEPGLLMWDNITKNLPAHNYPGFETISTNPCAELALSAYDSCRLISQNLSGWVVNPFTPGAYFDYEQYWVDTRIAQRMSDGLVELEIEAVSKIIEVSDTAGEKELWTKIINTARNGRRTGLGTHGLADAFLALGVKYDSQEAIDISGNIYKTHMLASYTESVQLAKERGAFPVWNWETDSKSEFFNKFPPDLIEDIKKYGRRNISNCTLAPTGSVAVVSESSSGCEPVFRWVFDRMVKITHTDIKFPVDFVDAMGDNWTKFRVIHPAVKEYFKIKGIRLPIVGGRDFSYSLEEANKIIIDQLPSHFVTSDQVDYVKGVELQSKIQEYIDHGISKTINMPKGTKKEEVSQVYLKAWKMGLKGVTVYVDGSRDGVLITESKPKKDDLINRPASIIENHAPKRPISLPAEIHHVKVKGQDWSVVVGLLDNKPFEVFAGQGLVLPKTNKIDEATIVRESPNRYKLNVKMKDSLVEEFEDLKEIYDSDEQRVITRSVCRELRHGVPIEFIVKDLSDHTGSISDFSAALSRVLKKYANRANLLVKKCSQCGGTNFAMVESCATCTSCGNSKCN